MAPVRATLRRVSERLGFERDWYLIVLGALVGTLTAIGAVAFMAGLEWTAEFSTHRRERMSLWLLPLIPMAGALGTGLLVYFFAPDAKGHGVPEVMRAIIQKRGIIKLRVGVVKVLASICTVGSGGSGGAEGPIVQIGSTVGSASGQGLGVERTHMVTLVGCGAAAGIASVFNAPIAGVFFVLEILLRDFSLRTFTPIVVSAVFSAATTQAILGRNEAIFASTHRLAQYEFTLIELPSYIALGVVCGVVAVAFGRLLHMCEAVFGRARVHPILRPVLGALLLGAMGIGFLLLMDGVGVARSATPPFFGNGYDVIRRMIDPAAYIGSDGAGALASSGPRVLLFLALLLVCKVVGTAFTLGSGGSGGTFAPSLFMGAAAGGAFGVTLDAVGLLPEGSSPAAFALVGMAALVAASTHAPLTAILMLFELTRDVRVLLPIMLAAVVATVVAQLIERDSIYTSKLRQEGLRVGSARDLTILRRIPVASCQITPLPREPVYPSDPLAKLVTLHAYHSVPDFVVVDQDGAYVGMVTGNDMRAALIDREAIPLLLVAELLRTDLPTVDVSEHLDTVMDKLARFDVSSLALLDEAQGGRVVGLLTRSKVLTRYHEALEEH